MKYQLLDASEVRNILNKEENKGKELRTMSGFGWKGKSPIHNRTMEDVERLLDWGCAFDVEETNDYVFVNGFSENDMY